MDESPLTKISFGFTEEDMTILRKVKDFLRTEHGEVPNIVAIRTALRKYVASCDRGEK